MEDTLNADVLAAPRSYAFIQFSAADGVARLTLNRPPANVLSVEVMSEINHALESLEFRRDVKVLTLSATGKYFSAGFELQDHLGDRAYPMLEEFGKIFEQIGKFDKPVVAVVAGPALGAGSILAAGCDIVLAGASARFGHPEIKGGVFNHVAAALLPRLVGRKKAFEMILGGGLLTAAEAEKIGLVSRVLPDERLEAEADVIHARAPVLLGDADTEQVQVGHPFQEGALEPVLAVEVVDPRGDLAGRPPPHRLLHRAMLVGQLEIDHLSFQAGLRLAITAFRPSSASSVAMSWFK